MCMSSCKGVVACLCMYLCLCVFMYMYVYAILYMCMCTCAYCPAVYQCLHVHVSKCVHITVFSVTCSLPPSLFCDYSHSVHYSQTLFCMEIVSHIKEKWIVDLTNIIKVCVYMYVRMYACTQVCIVHMWCV